jgi:hypothetical protein
MANNYLQYIDPHKKPTDRTTKNIDPTIINEIIRQSRDRGYDPKYTVALAGAETNFGTKKHGIVNPMSYVWRSDQPAIDRLIANTPDFKQLKQHTAEMITQGMPITQALASERYGVDTIKAKASIINSLNTLDDKKEWLKKKSLPTDPAHLTWAYQGTGIPNKYEIPHGYAYGKPVKVNTPRGEQPTMVRQMMTEFSKKGNQLGDYIRSFR